MGGLVFTCPIASPCPVGKQNDGAIVRQRSLVKLHAGAWGTRSTAHTINKSPEARVSDVPWARVKSRNGKTTSRCSRALRRS